MVQGILIIVFMLAIMALMVTRKIPTVVALIVLSTGICLIGGVPVIGVDESGAKIGFLDTVIVSGATKLSTNIMIAVFAGWLGSVIENITKGNLKTNGVVSRTFKLEEWETAFDYATGKYGDLKVAFVF